MKDNYSEKNLFPYVEYPRENPDEINWEELDGKRAKKDCGEFNKTDLGKLVLKNAKEIMS